VLVRHFMTRGVVTLDAALPCEEALRCLRERGIRRAPVLEAGELRGIVTERDLVAALPWRIDALDSEAGRAASRQAVREIMSKPVLTAGPNEHLDAVAKLLMTHHVGALPVVELGQVVGIVTESDLFRVFVRMTAADGDGLRLMLQRPERVTPTVEPLAAALRLGLAVKAYFTHATFGGVELVVVRVEGARAAELAPRLVDAGWILVDHEGKARRASA
jgi:acetoin utilization protein AcuB